MKRTTDFTNCRALNRLKDESGSTLIGVMVAAVVLAIIAISQIPLLQQHQKFAHQVNSSLSATILRSNLLSHIKNDLAWTAARGDTTCNESFSCLNGPGGCPPNPHTPREIRCLYNAAGEKVFDAREANGTSGFTEGGASCTGFSATVASPNCPFRPVITWNCGGTGPCSGADPIKITVQFKHSGAAGSTQLNLGRFSIVDEIR